MKRRHFIRTTGLSIAAIILADPLTAFATSDSKEDIISYPSEVSAVVNNQLIKLTGKTNHWEHGNLVVELIKKGNSLAIEIQAPGQALSSVTLSWPISAKKSSLILNDHWERTYGDVSWHKPQKDEIFPWYFMEYNGKKTNGFGVKTGTKTFCSWLVSDTQLKLNVDTKSGGNGVNLGNRKLNAAKIVTIKGNTNETPFQTTRRFTKIMCDKPRMPKEPVYGINDWYYTYGNNSEKLILTHTELMQPMSEGLSNRPFSVIDSGWFQTPSYMPNDCCWGDNMHTPDNHFSDMGKLAEKIRNIGMRPGIWTRPLCGSEKDPKTLMLPLIKGRKEKKPVLDPTIPENMERVKNYFKLYNSWGYEMVKFDFTTYDIFGKWGFEMIKDNKITESDWSMNDNSRTNAEIILEFYQTIREAAGGTYIIGCNTISHLSAGLFELNRIGDDTSGNEWERTRKMGVNTLAFRGLTHGTFYAADPDCVGLTTKIDWEKNKQWMELVAKSGVPLFISAQPEAVGPNQRQSIKECFKLASGDIPVGEPLDWMEDPLPKAWKLNGKKEYFNWG
jgi:alpha-galactosidase